MNEYFMNQRAMRKARWELAVFNRKLKEYDGKMYATYYTKCGCGCGPILMKRREG